MSAKLSSGVLNAIEKIASDVGFKNHSVKVISSNENGEGYMGELMFISVINEDNKETLDLVLKNAFSDKLVRNVHPIRNLYLNEITFYDTIWPAFENLFKEHQLGKPSINVPKYYASSKSDGQEFLILENLKKLGYDVFDKTKFLTKEQYKYVFRKYAEFHAMSYVLKKKHPESIKKIKDNLGISVEQTVEGFRSIGMQLINAVFLFFERGVDDDIKQAFQKYTRTGWDVFAECAKYDGDFGVLIHGDSWNNNMMIKQDASGKFTDMALIDFQIVRFGSPVHDLAYCLYTGATKDVLDSLDELQLEYHKSLGDTLKTFGENVDDIYPFAVLKEEWIKHCKFGLFFSFLIWSVRTTKKEDLMGTEQLVRKTESRKALNPLYYKIMKDLIRHVHSINAL